MENDVLASFKCQNWLLLSAITATYSIFCVVGGPLEWFSMRYSPWVSTLSAAYYSSFEIWPQLFKKVDSIIHWINHYALKKSIDFDDTFPTG